MNLRSMPPRIQLRLSEFVQQGVYLTCNGVDIYLWLGSKTSGQILRDLFNVDSIKGIIAVVCWLASERVGL